MLADHYYWLLFNLKLNRMTPAERQDSASVTHCSAYLTSYEFTHTHL